ncbi:MAG TPA: phosphatase [Bacillota bacterium]|nr:phosphatase [Bacillota bacterium]
MNLLVDPHCHTISSGHAYSTIKEIAEAAAEKGLKLIAMTDHGPAMPGGPHIFHLGNQRVIPDYINGVRVLKGVEADIIDFNGGLDVPEKYLKMLDIVIASLHEPCIPPGSVEDNTKALIAAMNNPLIDVIAHPGNPVYPIDIDRFVQCACETGTLIEINNSSFTVSRKGSHENCIKIAAKAKEMGAMLIVSSDCHICYDVGGFDKVKEIFEELEIPEELVINTDFRKLIDYLNKRGRNVSL